MGVWAGPDWPQAGLEQSRRLPLPGARTAGGASRIPEQPRPGDALAPGTLARVGYHGGSPLHAREQRPFGTMGLPPPPPSGEIQRQRSAARHGARRRESKSGGGRGHGEDGGGRGSPRAVPPASGRCPQPRSGGRGGNADQQPFNPRPRGSAHKEERDPPPPPGRRRPDALLQPTVSGAGPARVPRGPGAGVCAGRPLSRTHPQLRAPAHGGTRSDSGRLAAPLSVRLLCRQSARPPTG